MSAHTPGPWALDAPEYEHIIDDEYHCINGGKGRVAGEGDGFHIAGVIRLDDARLMAAAPDMLEALKSCLEQAEGCWAHHYGESIEESATPAHIAMARAAIAKATSDPCAP